MKAKVTAMLNKDSRSEKALWQAAELLAHRLPDLRMYLDGPIWTEPEKDALAHLLSWAMPIIQKRKSAYSNLWQEEKAQNTMLEAYGLVCAGCGTPIMSADYSRI